MNLTFMNTEYYLQLLFMHRNGNVEIWDTAFFRICLRASKFWKKNYAAERKLYAILLIGTMRLLLRRILLEVKDY